MFEPYLQKINSQTGAGHSKYRLCVTNLNGNNINWVELKMNVKTNPYFLDHEEGMSLVTSTDMRNLHDSMHNTTNKLMQLEYLQEDFQRSEEDLMKNNDNLQGDLRLLSILQLIIIVSIGVVWLLVIRSLK